MPLLVLAAILGVYMTLLYVIAVLRADNGTADIGYGGAFILLALSALTLSGPITYALLLVLLVVLWGVRLVVRIFKKNRHKPEDFRYRAWREAWGKTFYWRSYLQIYLLQGAIAYVISLPVTLALLFPSAAPYLPLVYVGLGIWLTGFFFEAVGDFQLDRFIRNPENKGKIMSAGLWRYSRHPNYFGESTMWWGIAIISAGVCAYPVVGFVAPLLITYLLLYVSGVPMLEKKWAGNPEWELYKQNTSVFVPLPPGGTKGVTQSS